MPHRSRWIFALAFVTASLLSPPRRAPATTFVAVPDEELARRAALVAQVRVVDREAAPTERPATDYRVEVERVLQGDAPGSVLVVRLPGGMASGVALRVWGAPRFHAGERAILFLVPGGDGSYRLVDLMLGAFHQVDWEGRRLALRDLAEARLLAPAAGGWRELAAPPEPARDLERFADWLAERARGAAVSPDYLLDLPREAVARAGALLARDRANEEPALGSDGVGSSRWSGRILAQLGPASVGSDAVRRALETLDVGGQRTESLFSGGAGGARGGLERFDAVDSFVLGDAASAPDLARFGCAGGGLVALSGTWLGGDGRALGGDVILAAGAECLFVGAAGLANARALVGYEATRAFRVSTAAAVAPPRKPALPDAAHSAPARAQYGGPPASSPSRGYRPRACGFDMNRNGIFGEAADCHVCDGSTLDPDHDGVVEHQIYVSCQTGTDSAACGSPGNPCRTIGFAWSRRVSPAASAGEDIVCFRGVCHEDSIAPGASGKPGFYVKPRAGTEARDWQLPKNPTMLVGWDYNHNGQYPPFDTADVAVLDGAGLERAIALNADTPRSYLELAHFTVRDYGRGSQAANTGFISFGGAAGMSSHIYIHDLSLSNVNQGRPLTSGSIVFDLFTRNTQVQHVAVENVEIRGSGGYIARGSGPSSGPDSGPLRFERISFTGQGCNDAGAGACGDPASEAHVVGWKLWGYISGIEVLDSILDLNTAAWRPHASGFGSTAFLPAQCSRDWTIRNNEIRDFKVGMTVQGYASGFCDGAGARPVDGVVFDRNVFRNTFAPWIYGDNGVSIVGGGPNARTTVGSVQVSNNFFSSAPGWQGMLYVDAGNGGGADGGAFSIVNNTTVANLKRPGFGAITLVRNNAYLPQTFTVKNNVISGLGAGQEAVHADYAPALWDADANVYAPQSGFTWNGSRLAGIAGWRSAARADRGARACSPSFANGGAGDFHLLPADRCARGAATPLGSSVATDIDGRVRPPSGWDAGAHQVSPAPGKVY
jgi:hypothetical protein